MTSQAKEEQQQQVSAHTVPPPQPLSLHEAAERLYTATERDALRAQMRDMQTRQALYLHAHPEVGAAVRGALAALVCAQPDDAVAFLRDYVSRLRDEDDDEEEVVVATSTR